jgi:hypothetical protein
MTSPIIDKPNEFVRGLGETTWVGAIVAPPGAHLALTRWRDARHELPEEGKNVLMALLCGEEWTGFLADDGSWKFISGDSVNEPVTHWMDYPAAPPATKEPQP